MFIQKFSKTKSLKRLKVLTTDTDSLVAFNFHSDLTFPLSTFVFLDSIFFCVQGCGATSICSVMVLFVLTFTLVSLSLSVLYNVICNQVIFRAW